MFNIGNKITDNLKVVGFAYNMTFINYAFAMMFITTNLGFKKFDEAVSQRLTEDISNEQRIKYGESLMDDNMIRKYIHAYYYECKSFKPRPPVLIPREFCIEQNLLETNEIPELIMVLQHT
ncbi:uncharacterized protein LOC112596244 isoform X2 [Melanaphis sacchari]|uniref:uncharacterized protein LOC112596244 isoform X2 n=1 Tax=Melanaphis sacchari TaxID=742174 RepID=UPI000DC12FCF|nr:uncharacterized protein LOC112596244 isoform X2 [Melanaphis sacchari]